MVRLPGRGPADSPTRPAQTDRASRPMAPPCRVVGGWCGCRSTPIRSGRPGPAACHARRTARRTRRRRAGRRPQARRRPSGPGQVPRARRPGPAARDRPLVRASRRNHDRPGTSRAPSPHHRPTIARPCQHLPRTKHRSIHTNVADVCSTLGGAADTRSFFCQPRNRLTPGCADAVAPVNRTTARPTAPDRTRPRAPSRWRRDATASAPTARYLRPAYAPMSPPSRPRAPVRNRRAPARRTRRQRSSSPWVPPSGRSRRSSRTESNIARVPASTRTSPRVVDDAGHALCGWSGVRM